jgi:hypothetical protein
VISSHRPTPVENQDSCMEEKFIQKTNIGFYTNEIRKSFHVLDFFTFVSMKMVKSFGSASTTFLALVLFSMTVSIALASAKNYPNGSEYSISKKGALPANSENQLPYEERETEKDDELQDSFSLFYIISELIFVTPETSQNTCVGKPHNTMDAISSTPLYLAKRVLLI